MERFVRSPEIPAPHFSSTQNPSQVDRAPELTTGGMKLPGNGWARIWYVRGERTTADDAISGRTQRAAMAIAVMLQVASKITNKEERRRHEESAQVHMDIHHSWVGWIRAEEANRREAITAHMQRNPELYYLQALAASRLGKEWVLTWDLLRQGLLVPLATRRMLREHLANAGINPKAAPMQD
ncbi:hypothetical protein UFOVP613_10 [uncultured Caudovirales phage]|uniref:Uncharacterized protein n=1 Tax=uncultured Caudovirales phage TaxID=2100421 RepID=A0A6J5N9P7_9CAUD|nr:hypothetical protein UFOVP613_10 [uncultured Caudovirales phage]